MQLDLERCAADTAEAAFLFANKMPMRAAEQQRHDLRTIFNVLTLKSFNHNLQLFVQLLRPENKAFMAATPDWCGSSASSLDGGRKDEVVCIAELASSILTLSAIAPGASTLCTGRRTLPRDIASLSITSESAILSGQRSLVRPHPTW